METLAGIRNIDVTPIAKECAHVNLLKLVGGVTGFL